MEALKVTCTETNTHIEASYKVRKTGDMVRFLVSVRRESAQEMAIWQRSLRSQVVEWRAHNLAYLLHLYRRRAQDLDLEFPQKWYQRACYYVASWIYLW